MAIGLLARPLPEIDVGSSAARPRADVHLNVAELGLQEAVAHHMRDGEGVVLESGKERTIDIGVSPGRIFGAERNVLQPLARFQVFAEASPSRISTGLFEKFFGLLCCFGCRASHCHFHFGFAVSP